MASITLKSLPALLHRALKTRAAGHKRSLNKEILDILEKEMIPPTKVDIEAMLAREEQLRATLKFKATPQEIDKFKRRGRA